VSENRMLRIYGPIRDEMIGDCRKLHNEELYNLYYSPDTIRIIISKRRVYNTSGRRLNTGLW
jgi:hypothetical protein